MKKTWGYVEIVGETLMVVAAAAWITRSEWVAYVFALGAVMLSISRLAYGNQAIMDATPEHNKLNMTRLIRQRNIAIFMLVLTAIFMFVRHTTHIYQEMYLFPSSWIIPFVCFVVIEVYTAFRMPRLLN